MAAAEALSAVDGIDASIDIRTLQTVLTVAEEGSFRRAAARLGVNSSTISKAVRRLEDRVGVSLFERHCGGCRLTTAGASFSRGVRRVLQDLRWVVTTASESGRGDRGTLGIGVFESLSSGFARNLVERFSSSHPQVELRFVEGARGSHIRKLLTREIDLAFVFSTEGWTGDRRLFWREAVLVAVPTGHALAEAGRLSASRLRDHPILILRSDPGPEIHDYLRAKLTPFGDQPDVSIHAVGRENLLNLVGAGLGLSIVAQSAAAVTYPGVKFLPLENDVLSIYAIWLADNDNPILRRFLSQAALLAKASGIETEPGVGIRTRHKSRDEQK